MDFLELAEKRYSVRKFQDKPVEPEIIEKILKAGLLAPTARNLQPQRILVINSESDLQKLKKCTGSHYNAPAAMLICYDKSECWVREYDGKTSGEIDASIVTTHMMLESAALGIGTTWVMNFDPAAVRREYLLPDGMEPVALLVMGYPAEDCVPSPRHGKSKSPEELIIRSKK